MQFWDEKWITLTVEVAMRRGVHSSVAYVGDFSLRLAQTEEGLLGR